MSKETATHCKWLIFQSSPVAQPDRATVRLATKWDYYRFHKMSELRVSIAVLATEVASGSPSRTLLTRSGDSQARWIKLLT